MLDNVREAFLVAQLEQKPVVLSVPMDLQKQEIKAFFDSVTERELETKDALLPVGGTQLLGQAILDLPFKWLAAYKLQLFLYAKATGSADIGTANAWMGIDWKR